MAGRGRKRKEGKGSVRRLPLRKFMSGYALDNWNSKLLIKI